MKDKLENLPENLKNQTAKWQQYQDKDGKAGVEWEMPTTSVTITVEDNYGEPPGAGTMTSPPPPSLPARMTTAIPRRCLPPSPTK